MNEIWTQVIITVGPIVLAMIAAFRYSIAQANKKDKTFLDYLETMQTQQLEYYEAKNGHLERISKAFTKTIDKNTKALDNLTVEVKLIPSNIKK